MEKIVKNESRISILFSVQNIEANLTAYESIFAVINKSKSDLECIVFDNASTDKTVSKIEADKGFSELVTKGKAKLITSQTKTTLALAYAAALRASSGAYSLIIDNPSTINIGNLVAWISANRKSIKDGELFIGSHQIKTNKGGSSKKWMPKIFNSTIRFFTPLDLRDNTSGIIAVKTETVIPIFETTLSSAQHHLDILYVASCNEIILNEFVVNTDKNLVSKGFGSILLVPFLAFMLRWRYFISGSLIEMKLPKKVSFTNGNHPIYRFAFFTLILIASFMMPFLSKDFGMTWDEKQHNDYSQLSYNYLTSFGADSAAVVDSKNNADFIRQAYRFYGEQCNVVAAIIYNTFDLPPFETRHFIISLYGLLGLIFIALSAKELGGWRAGIIAILFTFFNPGWLGNSMNNPTDIPFATGFAMSLYFIIKILKALPKPKFSHLVWLAIGIGIGIGSRVGAFLIIAYLGLFLGVNWLNANRDKTVKASKLILPYAKLFLIVAVLGYIFGILLWPYALENPFKNPFLAFKKASDNSFYTNNVELFEGKRLYMLTQAPWYYVVKFLSIGNPIYLLLGFVLPVVLLRWLKEKINIGFILMLLFMVVFPIAYAEYSNLNYYNGWRHYLFILPPWIVLAAITFDFLVGSKNKIIQYISIGVLLILFIKPTYWIIKNHPNEYVYFNELVGGINGAYGTYETDYYSNSCRAAGEWIAKQEPNKKLVVGINNEQLTASYYANKINPNLEFVWLREYEEQKTNWDYMILTSRTFSQHELLNGSFPPKGTVFVVKADDVPLAAVVKRENNFMPKGYQNISSHHYDSAIYYFSKAVNYSPKDEEAVRMLGQAYLDKESFDTAEIYFDKAIEIFPENYTAWSNKGMVYFYRKEYDKALTYFDKALAFKRNLTESYYYAASCMFVKNNYEAAIKYLENAIANNGQLPEIYYNLGIAYLNTGKYNKAEEALSGALTLNPKMGSAYRALAETYSKMGKQAEANYCMQKFQELGGQ